MMECRREERDRSGRGDIRLSTENQGVEEPDDSKGF